MSSSNDSSIISPDSEDKNNDTIPDILKHALPMNIKAKGRAVRQCVRRSTRATIAHPSNIPDQKPIQNNDMNKENLYYDSNSTCIDPSQYRRLAIAYGGLVKDEYRRKIWPVLVNNCKLSSTQSTTTLKEEDNGIPSVSLCNSTMEELREHAEWSQVEMDVHRTLARFPPNIDEVERVRLQHQLTPLIVRILLNNANYKYFQGFHDVCLTVLLVLGEDSSFEVCSTLAEYSIMNKFLTNKLDETALPLIKLIYVILSKTDPELEWFLRRSEVGNIFALPWLLTWFAHSLPGYERIVRLFDFFIAAHPLMPIYFSTALVLFRGAELLSGRIDCDMAHVHSYLSRIPEDVPLEALISDAQDLFVAYPPSKLRGPLLFEYESALLNDQSKYGPEPHMLPLVNPARRWKGPWFNNEQLGQRAVSVTMWAVGATAAALFIYTKLMSSNPLTDII